MGCLGVHFALNETDLSRLLAAATDEERKQFVQEEIEQRWDKEHLYESDKAWDAIHRCLTDGTLRWGNGTYPLNLCILGEKSLYSKDDYIITLVRPAQVPDVALALQQVDQHFIRERYYRIDPADYGLPLSEEDLEYTWAYLEWLKDFFAKAAEEGRAVVFTADQ